MWGLRRVRRDQRCRSRAGTNMDSKCRLQYFPSINNNIMETAKRTNRKSRAQPLVREALEQSSGDYSLTLKIKIQEVINFQVEK